MWLKLFEKKAENGRGEAGRREQTKCHLTGCLQQTTKNAAYLRNTAVWRTEHVTLKCMAASIWCCVAQNHVDVSFGAKHGEYAFQMKEKRRFESTATVADVCVCSDCDNFSFILDVFSFHGTSQCKINFVELQFLRSFDFAVVRNRISNARCATHLSCSTRRHRNVSNWPVAGWGAPKDNWFRQTGNIFHSPPKSH